MKKLLLLPVYCIHWTISALIALVFLLRLRKPVFAVIAWCYQIIVGSIAKLYFNLEFVGRENIPKAGAYILAANHQSFLDPALLGLVTANKVKFISKVENFAIPILAPLFKLADVRSVDRFSEGRSAYITAFQRILEDGHPIAIFPEGAIPGYDKPRSEMENGTGLLPGKTGAVRLSIAAQVAIVPVGISGTSNALPPEAIPKKLMAPWPRGKKVVISFGLPISPKYRNIDEVDKDILRQETEVVMREISLLVKPELGFIPFCVPLKKADWQQIVDTEKSYQRKP